jgi:hypothetical protein
MSTPHSLYETVLMGNALNILGKELLPQIHETGQFLSQWSTEDGVPPHYALSVTF